MTRERQKKKGKKMKKGKVFVVRAQWHIGGAEVWLHSFLNSALNG